MFQFRRFPTYAYFIQRRLTQYCCAGFPHSEISGSKPICGSPKLIAACHVLLRLLMPRHSPCALISLTSRPIPSGMGTYCPNQKIFGSLENHAGFRVLKCLHLHSFIVVLPLSSTLTKKLFSLLLAPSSGIIIILFSFQGAAPALRPDFSTQYPGY